MDRESNYDSVLESARDLESILEFKSISSYFLLDSHSFLYNRQLHEGFKQKVRISFFLCGMSFDSITFKDSS